MQKSFRFTNSSIKALPANTDTRSTELEVSDTEVIGLKCLSGRTGNKRFLLRYTFHGTKKSISIGRFPEIDVGTARQIARRHKERLHLEMTPRQSAMIIVRCQRLVSFFTRPMFRSSSAIKSPGIRMFSVSRNTLNLVWERYVTAISGPERYNRCCLTC